MGFLKVCLMASLALMGTEGLSFPPPRPEWSPGVNACIKGYNNNILDRVFSLDECKRQCENSLGNNCKSVEYHSRSGRCVVSDANRNSQIRNFYQPCHDGTDWTYSEIKDNTQFCAAGGRQCSGQNSGGFCRSDCNNGEYESPFNSCGSGCTCCIPSALPTDWTFESKSCIIGNNDLILYRVSLNDCKTRCESNPGFVCRSVEYHSRTRRCSLSKANSGSQNYWNQCPNDRGWTYTEIRGPPPPAAAFAPAPAASAAPAPAPGASGNEDPIP